MIFSLSLSLTVSLLNLRWLYNSGRSADGGFSIPISLFQRFLIPGLLPETHCPLAKRLPLKWSSKSITQHLGWTWLTWLALGPTGLESPLPRLPKPLAWTEICSFGIISPSRAHFLKDPIGMCQVGGSLQAGAGGRSRANQGQFPKVVSVQAGNPWLCGWLGSGSKLCSRRKESGGQGERGEEGQVEKDKRPLG